MDQIEGAGPEDETNETEQAFLDLIAKDIETNPGSVVPITQEWVERQMKLLEGVVVDPDEELPDDVTF
jgi:antitoxin PrlF